MERIQQLVKKGKFDPETDSAYGLPKVRTKFKVAKAKKQVAETEGEGAASEETPAGEESAEKGAEG